MSSALPRTGVAVAHGARRSAPPSRLPALLRDPGAAGPVISLGAPLVATVLLQALDPASSALPTGQARFDEAGAWASLTPGALAGLPVPATTARGWVQLGALQRVLLGGLALPVHTATAGVLLLAAAASVVLLWALLRRTGAGLLAAGGAAAAAGIAPQALAVHGAAAPADLAVVEVLAAALLAGRRRGLAGPVAAGLASGLAVLATPLAVVLLPLVAAIEGAPPRRAVRAVEDPAERPGRRLAAAGVAFAAVLALAVVVALVLAAMPLTAAARGLAALVGAAPAPGAGLATFSAWAGRDPLSLLVAAVAVAVAAVRGPRGVAAAAGLLALLSLWPAGGDAIAPAALLLPLVAVCTARAIDGALVVLGHRLLRFGVLGAGWVMGVAALLVVSLAVFVGTLAGRPAADARPFAQATSWIASHSSRGSTALVPLAAWPGVTAGAGTVGWYAVDARGGVPASAAWTSARWVAEDAALRSRAGGALAAVLDRGRVVATFGTGTAAVRVLALPTEGTGTGAGTGSGASPSSSASASASESASAGTSSGASASASSSASGTAPDAPASAAVEAGRRSAGTDLADNPGVVLDATSRSLLRSGQVDARVSIALGQLLSDHRLVIAGFPAVAGETSARRQVLIGAVDGSAVPADATAAGVVLRYFSALRGDYAVDGVDAGQRGILITFPADPSFDPAS